MKDLSVVILAAGKSTRMKSSTSKVLHRVAGLPLVSYPIRESLKLGPRKVILVVAKGRMRLFEDSLGKNNHIEYCTQIDALGTGDAVLRTGSRLRTSDGYILIIPGDVPLVSHRVLEEFCCSVEKEGVDCAVISTKLPDPTGYGRILRNGDGNFVAIREEKDATDFERSTTEINTGIFLARSKWLFGKIKEIKPHNAQKEYYLTDVIELAVRDGDRIMACCMGPHEQFLGVNDRFDLAEANKVMYSCVARHWLANGVSILDPSQTYIDSTVIIGNDTYIAPFTFLKGKTQIGKSCTIETGAILEDTNIGDNVHIKPYTVIEKSLVKERAVIGPFSRVRPDTVLEKEVKIGNFVEVKKSILKKGVRASHLSYIGDATIGAKTNVGCGTITCNYDGEKKHRTIIGEGVFVGSDTQFVAPVRIGKGAVIGAGSTVTKDVPSGALALSRVAQVNVPNWVNRKKR